MDAYRKLGVLSGTLNILHPEDRVRYRHLEHFGDDVPIGFGMCFCEALTADDYLVLDCMGVKIRARPEAFTHLRDVAFFVAENVRIVTDPDADAGVWAIGWHHNQNQEMYFLRVNGKKKSRRYWRDELETIE